MQASKDNSKQKLEALEGRAVMVDVFKGGCGKSSLSLNIADRLANTGHNVLYLDLDPNGHITFSLGYDEVFYDPMHDYGYVTLDQKVYSKQDLEPHDMIYETDFGFDFVPSFDDMESFEAALNSVNQSEMTLGCEFLYPLYETGEYDYFILDGGGERSNIADNGFLAGKTAIVPLIPGDEALSAWKRTQTRVIDPLEQVGFNILAVVPNLLSKRIDYQTEDRELLERMNTSAAISENLPSFARLDEDDWEAIENGEYDKLPGIREREAISGGISKGMPAGHYDPECDQLEYFDEIVRIIEEGGVKE